MLNFGQKVEERSGDIMPKDQLLWAVIKIREIKNSQETGGRYLDIELTVADGIPFSRRKMWLKIADPFDGNNSEAWRTMGYGAIRRILEAVKGASPDNSNSYALARLEDLDGLIVPVITTIEKGKDGYDDKNSAEFLSPHSSVKKIVECFRLLQTGVYEYASSKSKTAAPPTQGSLLAGTANPPPVNMPTNVGAPTPAAHVPPAGQAAPSFLAPLPQPQPVAPVHTAPVAHQTAPVQHAAPQVFTQGQAPAPMAPAGFVAPQPQTSTTAAPPVQPAGISPSNGFQVPTGNGVPPVNMP